MKPVDIHFVSWNRPKITELAIKTIARNTKSANYRLVVLDNGSSIEQVEMLVQLHESGLIDELILWPENRGLEAARNHMLFNCAESEYFICADNDCLPQPFLSNGADWVEELVDLMNNYESLAAISCRTQVMIGTGNIFEGLENEDIVPFGHPGGSLRIMRTQATKETGGWRDTEIGRGSEERYICGRLHEAGWSTAFAVKVSCLHLFGDRSAGTDRWGYPGDWLPGQTGHSDISHPALTNGDELIEVEKYAGKELAHGYFGR